MNAHVERRLDAWIAVIELAAVVSAVAAVFAIGMSLAWDASQAAIVIPVIVAGFTASWTMTGRMQPSRVRHGDSRAIR
jgi:hypothetical protein